MNQKGLRSTTQHPTVWHDGELSRTLTAYLGGLNADLLQARINGEWGPIWSVPALCPEALERAGRQFTGCRAEAVRHYRRALLRRPLTQRRPVDVVVATELPSREQCVIRFDGVTLHVVYLEDATLAAFAASFSPFPRS
ncbi:MAG: hypothetical protein ACRYFS_14080 [Janthinobacterium lividum]